MLLKILKDALFAGRAQTPAYISTDGTDQDAAKGVTSSKQRVLNVGGNSKAIPIPSYYEGWEHMLLDIDPRGKPDVLCDARLLGELAPCQFDAIYCSHNLEHYFRHDVAKVLAGFHHVLKEDGFVDVRVPDMGSLIKQIAEKELDIEDFLYQSQVGPIHVIDVIYGWGREIEQSGNDFFAHKTGFTEKSLTNSMHKAEFGSVFTAASNLEVRAIAFKSEPSALYRELLDLDSGAFRAR